MLENKRILITGGSGSVGSELYRQLVPKNTVMSLDINETALFDLHEEYRLKGHDVHYRLGDVRNRETVKDTMEEFKPEVVFHAAALKHVTPNEVYPQETVDTNVQGTLNVIYQAKKHGVDKLVYISTDKAINSHCIMGVTKKLGELITRNAGYVAVRFGNVLGSRGSVIPIWQRQIDAKEPLTITDARMERYFMSIEEACALVIQAAEMDAKGTTLILDMGERVNVLKVAKDILHKTGQSEYPISMIGIRPGESLYEELMTPEEQVSAVRSDKFFIIK